MAKGDDIEERLVQFAIRITLMCDQLPQSRSGNHFAGQLLRSGTSPAAQYAEARGAESTKDFIHKMKLGLKELNESKIWLKIIMGTKLLPPQKMGELLRECMELGRIFNASITTAKKNL